ncbi:hypothetical protein Tco_1449406 [Tanacetum coccineum]
MKEYMTKTQKDYGMGIVRPKFNKDARFELKGQFLKELRDNTFSGSDNEDANEHIKRVLEIVDLFIIPNVTQDQLMLLVFPVSLIGAASRWLRNEPTGSITTWEILKGKFLSKYCPPSRLDVPTRQILDSKGVMPKINVVDAKKAIQEMADHSKKWHNRTSTRSRSRKTLEEAYYTQFGVPFLQGGRYKAYAQGFYQRDKGNLSYQDRRQTMEESLSKFMVESAKRHDENSILIKEIQASTDVAIRNQGASIKALDIQIGQMSKVLQERRSGSLPSSTETNLTDHVKSILINEEAETLSIRCIRSNRYAELEKLQVDSMESTTCLRRFLKEKSRIEEEIKATMNTHCSAIFEDALPPKEKDPGSIGKLAPTKLIIELADRTAKRPKGIAENVLIGLDNFVFPVDFIVLDMPEDIKIPLILGRPFLSTAHAKIDVFKRKITLRIGNDKIVSLDPEFRDFLKLNDLNEPLELRRNHGMEDLDLSIEEGEVIDEPMVDIVKTRHNDEIFKNNDEYPNFCDHDKKIHINCAHNLQFYNSIIKDEVEYKGKNAVGAFMNVPIFVGNFSIVTDSVVVENIDAYRDKYMGHVIVGKPFCRYACVEAMRFDGFITIGDGNDSVTYQMAHSHPRFKHLSNEQCNKIRPLLKVSARD